MSAINLEVAILQAKARSKKLAEGSRLIDTCGGEPGDKTTQFVYFAYGSNMSTPRLRARTPSARPLGTAILRGHTLCFHKRGKDGSAKCNAFATGVAADSIIGILFAIDSAERGRLDGAEGLNKGYRDATVTVSDAQGRSHDALIYIATPDYIDDSLKPFAWYKAFVMSGASEHGLPPGYLATFIEPVQAIADPDEARAGQERAILKQPSG